MAASKARYAPAPAPSPARPAPPAAQGNVIAAGCHVTGDLILSGSLRLAGEITGDVHCEGTLVVEASGRIRGHIRAAEITVLGTLIGEIVASRHIEVGRGAHIEGSIFAPSMRVEGNAVLDGDLLISPERSPAHAERARKLAPPRPAADPSGATAGA